MYNAIIQNGIWFVTGGILTYIIFKLKQVELKIEQTYLQIPTPEEMAKEILKIKLPIASLPPEILERIKTEREQKVDPNNQPPSAPQPVSSPLFSDKQPTRQEIHSYTG